MLCEISEFSCNHSPLMSPNKRVDVDCVPAYAPVVLLYVPVDVTQPNSVLDSTILPEASKLLPEASLTTLPSASTKFPELSVVYSEVSTVLLKLLSNTLYAWKLDSSNCVLAETSHTMVTLLFVLFHDTSLNADKEGVTALIVGAVTPDAIGFVRFNDLLNDTSPADVMIIC